MKDISLSVIIKSLSLSQKSFNFVALAPPKER
ncbi:hypothetical protein CoNPh15_CDS0113 [Staphylococcus phage S-CoN_Ph15]|nr:hypothetical protein CoNPh14_CDS0059 [Staphylococcus phage S-CoN_Ph14]WNM53959.1 hypothetical protein CoNPh15_CDS0113 [Staphylococcus phage S-CoN_Ph15]